MVAGKAKYIDNLQAGQILAFRSGESVISGKVISLNKFITVETKNGTQFVIKNEDIVWVKTGQRWPKGVFKALKGEINSDAEAE